MREAIASGSGEPLAAGGTAVIQAPRHLGPELLVLWLRPVLGPLLPAHLVHDVGCGSREAIDAVRAPAAILCPAALRAGMAPLEPPPVSQAGSPTDWGELVQGPETNARHPKCRWPPAAGRGETAGPAARPLPSGPSRQGEQGKKVDGSAGAVIDCFFVCFASRSRFWPP